MSIFLESASRTPRSRQLQNAIPLAITTSGNILYYSETSPNLEVLTNGLIELPEGDAFHILPETRPALRTAMMIVGSSGSGKSTIAADFGKHFLQVFPKGRVYIVSIDTSEDPAFEGIPHERIPVDESLEEVSISDIGSNGDPDAAVLVIFDDVEGLQGKRKKALEAFTQRVLETGRKHNVHTISIHHRPANGTATKSALTESNSLVFFPRGANSNLAYTLKRYYSIPPEIKHVLKTFGRWVQCRVDIPVIIGETKAAYYDTDEVASALKEKAAVDRKKSTIMAKAAVDDMMDNMHMRASDRFRR